MSKVMASLDRFLKAGRRDHVNMKTVLTSLTADMWPVLAYNIRRESIAYIEQSTNYSCSVGVSKYSTEINAQRTAQFKSLGKCMTLLHDSNIRCRHPPASGLVLLCTRAHRNTLHTRSP